MGWSEGSTVAMATAEADADIGAIALMAPVVDGFARTLQAQYRRMVCPNLLGYVSDGVLDADASAKARAGTDGVLAGIYLRMFQVFVPGQRINPLLDGNGDGRIAVAEEADTVIAGWFADGRKEDSGLRRRVGLWQASPSRCPPPANPS